MYQSPQNRNKLRLRDENGVVFISDYQSEAFNRLRAHYPLSGPYAHPHLWVRGIKFELREYDPRSKKCVGPGHAYLLKAERTACGQVNASIIDRQSRREYERQCARRRAEAERHFRKQPVPRTGRGRRALLFRSPQTRSELKALNGLLHDEERHEYQIRLRMKRKYLPTAWEDRLIYSDNSWKRYRKTQWKPKGELGRA